METTFESVHKPVIDQRREMADFAASIERGEQDGCDMGSFYYWAALWAIISLDTCLDRMRKDWDGKECELFETHPGYDPPWVYGHDMLDAEMLVCGLCGYAVAEDEYLECLQCGASMCLFCYRGRPCPEHGEALGGYSVTWWLRGPCKHP